MAVEMKFVPAASVADEPEDFFAVERTDDGAAAADTGSMSEYMDQLNEIPSITAGNLAKGYIIKATHSDVYVDIAHKTEGIIPRSEFDSDEEIKIGAPIEALIVKQEDDGSIILSKKKARIIRAWDEADTAFQGAGLIRAKVIAKVKGGLQASFKGLKAFVPGSLMSLQQEYDLEKYLNQTFDFKIIEFNRRRRNMVLSRKAILEEERQKQVTEALTTLKDGEVCEGVVKNITDYGAFVSIMDGKIDGLLHKADMSWGHVRDVATVVKVGDKITVKVLAIDRENEKISLGLKQLNTDPWEVIETTFRVGEVCSGSVKNLTQFGAFVEIAPGIEGLVHISDMSWTERIKHPKDVLEIDSAVQVKILNIDPEERKIALGMKQVHPDPWSLIEENYQIGEVVKGKVKNLTDFGGFIELQDGVEGLIHISDMSWTGRIKHPSEVLTTGDSLEVKILDIDPRNKKISLGLKQVNPDPWEIVDITYPVGSVATGKVRKLMDYGAFVELKDGIQGLLHISDISWQEKVTDLAKHVAENQELRVKILDVNKNDRKVSLGLKQLENEPWKEVATKYPVGSTQKGKVVRITQYGAFLELEKGVEGLLHISDWSWTERVQNMADKVTDGQELEVKVLDVNEDDRKVSLGVKQLAEDPYSAFTRAHGTQGVVEGEVLSINEFGVFVKLPFGLEGLVRSNQVTDEPGKRPEDIVKIGEKIKVRVMEVNKKDRKIRLSIKGVFEAETKVALEQFKVKQGRATDGSIGGRIDADTIAKMKALAEGKTPEKGD